MSTPSLRARFFANPTREVGRNLPPSKSWDYHRPERYGLPWHWPGSPIRYRLERQQLAKAILEYITTEVNDRRVAASINTDSVFEDYFAPIVRASQRSFTSIYVLSIAAFVTGVALISVGALLALHPTGKINSTIVASIFGGGGVISSLGAVLAMANSGIRGATLDLARVRVVLTAFATQLGHLRAIIEQPAAQVVAVNVSDQTASQSFRASITDARSVNDAIGKSMSEALTGLPLPQPPVTKPSKESTADDQQQK
jgi:hypothetical protein